MKGRFSAVCMVAVMLTTMLGAPLAASGEVMQETTTVSQEITTTEPRDYPNGWTCIGCGDEYLKDTAGKLIADDTEGTLCKKCNDDDKYITTRS